MKQEISTRKMLMVSMGLMLCPIIDVSATANAGALVVSAAQPTNSQGVETSQPLKGFQSKMRSSRNSVSRSSSTSSVDSTSSGRASCISFQKCIKDNDLDKAIQLLHDGKVEINTRGFEGVSPLMIACAYVSYREIYRFIDYPFADINAKDDQGRTPLIHSIISNNLQSALELLKRPGVDVNARDISGKNALQHIFPEAHSTAIGKQVSARIKSLMDKDAIPANQMGSTSQPAVPVK